MVEPSPRIVHLGLHEHRVTRDTFNDGLTCGFCQGEPVANAASWADGKPRPPAACPRCGKVAPC